jgi:hypothetical protein
VDSKVDLGGDVEFRVRFPKPAGATAADEDTGDGGDDED